MSMQGVMTALVTPFREDGTVNLPKLRELIELQIEGGVCGIVLLGTTGEASTVHEEEAQAILQTGVEAAGGRVPILAGCGANDTSLAVKKARAAQALGVDGLLVLTPYYNKASDRGMEAHFLAVAEAVSLPMLLYNVPSRTGCRISMPVLRRLSAHPNIVGIKEASGDISYLTEAAAVCGEGFALWSGNDDLVLPTLALGGSGVISVAANIVPTQMCELTGRFFRGDIAGAREVQLRLLPLIRALFMEVNPIPIKEAMNLLGFGVGGFRLPLCGLSEEKRGRLREVVK